MEIEFELKLEIVEIFSARYGGAQRPLPTQAVDWHDGE